MRIILMGPPGAGKGTQAALLKERLNLPYLASGDLLRKAIKEGKPLGEKIKAYMEGGRLVPDEWVLDLIMEHLAQARALDETLKAKGQMPIDLVINLKISDDQVVQRLAGRRICTQCEAVYHIERLPPQKTDRCDRCGGLLEMRRDDRPETVRQRLDVYHRQTEPVLEFYRSQGKLRHLSGMLDAEDQYRALVDLLKMEGLMQ
jgi:adenylate kinase